MIIGQHLRAAMAVACITLGIVWSTARAEEVPIITGKHWSESSEQLKKAYLVGVANALQVEAAYQAANAPSDAQSLVPRFGRGLKGHSLDSVREGLDRWYTANPDKLQRPVIEVIWFEMVVPGLKKTS